jgi:hypothetical protein
MASFLVLAPRSQNGQRDDDSTIFIRDGFAILALILPVPWLLVHRLWFEAALVMGLTIVISVAGNFTGHDDMAAFATALFSLFVGFEANNWRAAALERRGFEEVGIVDSDNAADAETAWFLGPNFAPGLRQQAPVDPKVEMPSPPAGPKPVLGGMVGLVSHRGDN